MYAVPVIGTRYSQHHESLYGFPDSPPIRVSRSTVPTGVVVAVILIPQIQLLLIFSRDTLGSRCWSASAMSPVDSVRFLINDLKRCYLNAIISTQVCFNLSLSGRFVHAQVLAGPFQIQFWWLFIASTASLSPTNAPQLPAGSCFIAICMRQT